MDADSFAFAAIAAICLRQPAATAHLPGALLGLHCPICQAAHIRRDLRRVIPDYHSAFGLVSSGRALEIRRRRCPGGYAIGVTLRAATGRKPSYDRSAQDAGTDLNSVLSHGVGDSD